MKGTQQGSALPGQTALGLGPGANTPAGCATCGLVRRFPWRPGQPGRLGATVILVECLVGFEQEGKGMRPK